MSCIFYTPDEDHGDPCRFYGDKYNRCFHAQRIQELLDVDEPVRTAYHCNEVDGISQEARNVENAH